MGQTAVKTAPKTKTPGSDWETVSVDRWTSDHVNFILHKSAWGKVVGGETALTNEVLGARPVMLQSETEVQLRSAMLVRYALFRQRQISQKYDAMNPSQRRTFDDLNKDLLACPVCDKYYVIGITGASSILRDKDFVTSRLNLIFLSNEAGEKRQLVKFTPQTTSNPEALFFFLRNNEKGEPLLSPLNTKLIFNFRIAANEDLRIKTIEKLEFNVPGLVREGKVIF